MAETIQSLDQERAAFAWTCVADCDDEYTNLAKGAPALVMSNGLMQTLAFYKGKSKNRAHERLLDGLLKWVGWRVLEAKPGLPPKEHRATFEAVMSKLHGGQSDTYLLATEESLELLRWIRQFAPAVTKGR